MIIKREQREKDQNKRKHATSKNCLTLSLIVACEHALRGALATGREKEGELATTSLDLNVCIEKVDAKCSLVEMTIVMASGPLQCCATGMEWVGGGKALFSPFLSCQNVRDAL